LCEGAIIAYIKSCTNNEKGLTSEAKTLAARAYQTYNNHPSSLKWNKSTKISGELFIVGLVAIQHLTPVELLGSW